MHVGIYSRPTDVCNSHASYMSPSAISSKLSWPSSLDALNASVSRWRPLMRPVRRSWLWCPRQVIERMCNLRLICPSVRICTTTLQWRWRHGSRDLTRWPRDVTCGARHGAVINPWHCWYMDTCSWAPKYLVKKEIVKSMKSLWKCHNIGVKSQMK